MSQFIVIVLFIIGLLLIIKGGDYFVDSAVWFAEALNVPKFIIGATIVSFATTLPELLVSLFAALAGKNVMAAGNAIRLGYGKSRLDYGHLAGLHTRRRKTQRICV